MGSLLWLRKLHIAPNPCWMAADDLSSSAALWIRARGPSGQRRPPRRARTRDSAGQDGATILEHGKRTASEYGSYIDAVARRLSVGGNGTRAGAIQRNQLYGCGPH